jgi:hypothetical protein
MGRALLAGELSSRLEALGAVCRPLVPEGFRERISERRPDPAEGGFHWGRWFAAAARGALDEAEGSGGADGIGYAGAGALALAGDALLDGLCSAVSGEVVTNNRFSADAFVVAGAVSDAIGALEESPTDNGAVRRLEDAGLTVRDLSAAPWSRFDVDTPLDLALLRLGSRLPGARSLNAEPAAFLETARLPGDRPLEVPQLAALGEVIRSREAQLVVAGRIPSAALAYLETESACRVRSFVEERGMRAAPESAPRSLLADWTWRHGPADLVAELASLGDGVILDSRVLMAAFAGSSDAGAWPPEEERFASDFGDLAHVATPWLHELVQAAADAPVPFLLGGHALVSDGLRILVDAAWAGQ